MLSSRPSRSLLLATILLTSACVSTQDRMDRATEADARGDFAAAAEDFIRVLDREPNNQPARDGLVRAAQEAVLDMWTQATSDEEAERYMAALERLADLEGLSSRASNVGVDVEIPGDLDGFRTRVQNSAVDQSVSEARRAIELGQPDRAATSMAALLGRFQLGLRRPEVVRLKAEAELESARDLIEDGNLRAAWERAETAIGTLGATDSAIRTDAQALQREAIRFGTRSVALVPFWRTDAFSQMAPELLRTDLNYTLENAEEPPLPMWLQMLDPDEVERVIRRRRDDRRILMAGDMRELGRILGADVVVTGELISLDAVEEVMSERRVPVRTKGAAPVDTAFVIQQVRVAIGLRAAYRVVDVHTGVVLDEGEVPAAGTSDFQRGSYQGDAQMLDLNGNQLTLFNFIALTRGIEEAERGLARGLATQIRERAIGAAMSTVQ